MLGHPVFYVIISLANEPQIHRVANKIVEQKDIHSNNIQHNSSNFPTLSRLENDAHIGVTLMGKISAPLPPRTSDSI